MCGITGIFDLRGRRRIDRETIQRMTATIAHRGPDECTHFVDGDFACGFQRLSIIDVRDGHQPMWSEDGSVMCVCNGEIYNHKQLRLRLERNGHRLENQCDVAVLPHLYEDLGTDLVNELDGQFAFAIFDRKRNRLFAARDHFGIVPFFYAVVDGLLLFGSEIKAILAHPVVCREVDLTGLDQILCFPGLVSPTTMFKGIKSLACGHRLTASTSGVDVSEYWDLDYPLAGDQGPVHDEAHYVEGVRELLCRSVRKRLMSDVPLGLYLSGGLDSSLVSALACGADRLVQRHSFGISFHGADMCEQRYQRRVAHHLNTLHHDVSFTPADVAREFARVIYHAECPVKESYDATCLGLSRTTKQAGVSVVLTGQGADELFGGYIGYKFDTFYRQRFRRDANESAERSIRERLWGDPDFAYDRNYTSLIELKRNLYSSAARAALPQFDALSCLSLPKNRVAGRHILHKRSYLDFKLRLADHLLADHGDRMAMANAVEVRHPFLDIDLVKFVATVPPQLTLKDQTEKYVLRQIAQSLIPPEIAQREKFGWFAHASSHMIRHGGEYLRDLLSIDRVKRQGYFDPAMFAQLMERYMAPDFVLNLPFESDVMMLVVSFNLFLDTFNMPSLN
jgi:asparagine synthase (glutamine-hydrolysing)